MEEFSLYKFHKTACRNEGVCFMVRFRVTIESRGVTEEERWSSYVEMERR